MIPRPMQRIWQRTSREDKAREPGVAICDRITKGAELIIGALVTDPNDEHRVDIVDKGGDVVFGGELDETVNLVFWYHRG